MKTKLNRIGISIIIVWSIIMLLIQVLDLEFVSVKYEGYYWALKSFIIPFSLILFVLVSLSKTDDIANILAQLFLICFISFTSLIISVALFMCVNITDEILFINKNNNNIRIIERHLDCGATNTSLPIYSIEKIIPFTPLFIRATRCDTSLIDKEEWIEVIKM